MILTLLAAALAGSLERAALVVGDDVEVVGEVRTALHQLGYAHAGIVWLTPEQIADVPMGELVADVKQRTSTTGLVCVVHLGEPPPFTGLATRDGVVQTWADPGDPQAAALQVHFACPSGPPPEPVTPVEAGRKHAALDMTVPLRGVYTGFSVGSGGSWMLVLPYALKPVNNARLGPDFHPEVPVWAQLSWEGGVSTKRILAG